MSDSNTYDITAWSLPYAYGIQAYAVKEKLDVSVLALAASKIQTVHTNYGLIIPYTSLNAAKLMGHLLQKGVKIRYATTSFQYKGKTYPSGTLVILKTSNSKVDWNALTNEACLKFHIQADAVETGFMDKGADFGSTDMHVINSAPRVVLLSGEQTSSLGAGEIWQFFDQQLNYPLTLVNVNDFSRFNLKNYQVLIVPDGNYKTLMEKATTDKLKDFVRSGGKLIALESAAEQMAGTEWGFKLKEDKTEDKTEDKNEYAALKIYGDQERNALTSSIPGAIYKVDLDSTHPLAFGYPNFYYTLKKDDTIFEFLKEGWNVGVLKKNAYVTGFSGFKVKNKLKDGLLFGVQNLGAGSVVLMADNPMFRQFWENGKLMFCNALFFSGQ